MPEFDDAIDKAGGKVTEAAGKISGDKDMEARGKLQAAEADAKQRIDQATEGIRDAAESAAAGARALGDRVKKAVGKDSDQE